MIPRHLAPKLKKLAQGFPAIFITGPRQSGKTTLARETFPSFKYVSLENPENLDFALEDPKGFFKKFEAPCIIDEIQRAPLLLSYLQGLIDESQKPGQWILTGSQQFLLMEKISQTLAGRLAITQLLPFSLSELMETSPRNPVTTLRELSTIAKPSQNLEETMIKGFYPRLHTSKLDPKDWYSAYYQTYVERDVRGVLKIGDLATFRKFVRLCAGRSGQLVNFSSLAVDAGISPPTARSWISVLETSSLITLIAPHHGNFNKRLTKSQKLYFLDTGLLCYLLDISHAKDIVSHHLRGAIFETFVVSGIFKLFAHHGEKPPLYFWRDHAGHEIDLVVDLGSRLLPIEIKSSRTILSEFFKTMKWWMGLQKTSHKEGALCYAGEETLKRDFFVVHPWWDF